MAVLGETSHSCPAHRAPPPLWRLAVGAGGRQLRSQQRIILCACGRGRAVYSKGRLSRPQSLGAQEEHAVGASAKAQGPEAPFAAVPPITPAARPPAGLPYLPPCSSRCLPPRGSAAHACVAPDPAGCGGSGGSGVPGRLRAACVAHGKQAMCRPAHPCNGNPYSTTHSGRLGLLLLLLLLRRLRLQRPLGGRGGGGLVLRHWREVALVHPLPQPKEPLLRPAAVGAGKGRHSSSTS